MWPHLQEHWSAFHELSSERQIGMGMGPIPSSKIRDYAREQFDLEGEEADRFFTIVRSMDDEYLTLVNAASKPGAAGKGQTQVAADDVQGVRNLFVSPAEQNKKPVPKDKKTKP